MKTELATFRVRLLFFFVIVFAIVLISRLYFVQVVSGEEYSVRADRQYLRPSSSILNRGTIYFQTKGGTLMTAANQQEGFVAAINPSILENPEEVLAKISQIVPIERESFLVRAAKENDPYEEVAKKIAIADGGKIRDLKIPGLNVYKEKWRFYPNDRMAAHVLGIMAFRGDELRGSYGLEQFYEDTLVRKNDSAYSNFFVEIFLNVQKSLSGGESARGDIVTSIEPEVQVALERELLAINEKWKSGYTGGLIINPKNGEILAMAISPTFDPNNFKDEENPSIFSNKNIENVYEMGSIMKALTMAAGLDAGAVTAKTTYTDTGSLTLNNKTISNFDGKARGLTDMQGVLNESLNTGAVFVMRSLGKEKYSKYMLDFGLGERTGIDLPNEAAPLVENLKSSREIEHATASFGQGIAVSPVAAARALSALANGGVLTTPHVVSRIQYKTGVTKNIEFEEGRRVIKKETADEITRMLVHVADNALLGGVLKMPHYSVAAKTGTAQIALPDGRGYYDDRYFHSFFGYFPAYDARFLVFLFTYHPKEVRYASETLARPFFNLVKYLVNYYEIQPDR